MNKLILIAAVSVIANLYGIAHADALVAPQQTVVAQVENVSAEVQSVALLNDAQVKLTNAKGVQTLIKLNDTANEQLVKEANELQFANIVSEHHQIICMMMPLAYQPSLYVNGRLVLSPRGCYLSDVTYPEKSSDEKLAERLSEDLMVYAHKKPL